MPLFIPESLLQKEKAHVEGFAPEVAWVTMGGSEPLEDRLCVRPTSETLFCDHFAHVLHSYRDLPMKYNQWCSVLRWEKTTRPFLRTREFCGRRAIPFTKPRRRPSRRPRSSWRPTLIL
jgi:prolyl-tRNA synthetase